VPGGLSLMAAGCRAARAQPCVAVACRWIQVRASQRSNTTERRCRRCQGRPTERSDEQRVQGRANGVATGSHVKGLKATRRPDRTPLWFARHAVSACWSSFVRPRRSLNLCSHAFAFLVTSPLSTHATRDIRLRLLGIDYFP
jgi:hypothetical protein